MQVSCVKASSVDTLKFNKSILELTQGVLRGEQRSPIVALEI